MSLLFKIFHLFVVEDETIQELGPNLCFPNCVFACICPSLGESDALYGFRCVRETFSRLLFDWDVDVRGVCVCV